MFYVVSKLATELGRNCLCTESSAGGDLVVKMLKSPVTQCYTGHALVKMQSHKQAEWVVSDVNEMIFTVSMGPRPLQASVAQAGQWHTKREASITMGISAIGT